MRQPTAIIAEDEPLLRGELKDALAALWPDLRILAEAEDGARAIQALARHHPDVVFLDIQMPVASGLEVARVASGRCHVVFVTAYDEHAVAAFEAGAIDYVMKPLSTSRLATAIMRVKERVRGTPVNFDGLLKALGEQSRSEPKFLRWVSIAEGRNLRLITVEDVCYFQADNKYTLVVTPERESLIRRPIRQLATELDPNIFWQIHRATLVNVNAIAGLTRDIAGNRRVKLKQRKETLAVSEPYVHLFDEM